MNSYKNKRKKIVSRLGFQPGTNIALAIIGIPATVKSFGQGYESRPVRNRSVIEDISGISSG